MQKRWNRSLAESKSKFNSKFCRKHQASSVYFYSKEKGKTIQAPTKKTACETHAVHLNANRRFQRLKSFWLRNFLNTQSRRVSKSVPKKFHACQEAADAVYALNNSQLIFKNNAVFSFIRLFFSALSLAKKSWSSSTPSGQSACEATSLWDAMASLDPRV